MDFKRDASVIREQMDHLFMKGVQRRYIREHGTLPDPSIVDNLDVGEVVPEWSYSPVAIKVRPPLSDATHSFTEDQLNLLDSRIGSTTPDLPGQDSSPAAESSGELSENERQLLDTVKRYVAENDEPISKNKARKQGPVSNPDSVQKLLDQLIEKDLVTTKEVERHGQHYTWYAPL
jgi:hypothetical protein